jgi:hypothetical protein
VKELKLRQTVDDWYSNCFWYKCNYIENSCQTHVWKKVSSAKNIDSPCPMTVSGALPAFVESLKMSVRENQHSVFILYLDRKAL